MSSTPNSMADMARDLVDAVGDKANSEIRKQIAMQFARADGLYRPPAADLMADDFVFLGGIIGPLNRRDYLNTVGSFEVYNSFPDLQLDVGEFSQDPNDPDRFWSIIRVSGTHLAPQSLGSVLPAIPVTRNRLQPGPQAVSVTFDAKNKVRLYTGGYVADRREGNTGGLGAFFAVLKAINFPVPPPEAFALIRIPFEAVKDVPKSSSHADDLPGKYKALGRTYGLRTAEAWSYDRFSTSPKAAPKQTASTGTAAAMQARSAPTTAPQPMP
ncbi:hypothetical protein KFE25_007611 [Diacronema lutheri]|uniref:Uncharacterized protein n=2 Tax=Diacronema lutheri TaxID=2081491 RepID=A0A8J5XPH2_DIALT|nr:hypothetical protein KFE25_007611 [Diacronema lutheri]